MALCMPKDAAMATASRPAAVARRVAPAADGRTRRAQRSRDAIVDALHALVGEGVTHPTAQQVEARAGVGMRSVFRHFADMEALYAALGARVRADVRSLFAAQPAPGAVRSRLRALVGRRSALFDRIAPYKRAAVAHARRSPFLQARHRALTALLREELRRWLPELAAAPPVVAAALELLTSFEAWDRLRSEQRLTSARARETVERTVLALAPEPEEAERRHQRERNAGSPPTSRSASS